MKSQYILCISSTKLLSLYFPSIERRYSVPQNETKNGEKKREYDKIKLKISEDEKEREKKER